MGLSVMVPPRCSAYDDHNVMDRDSLHFAFVAQCLVCDDLMNIYAEAIVPLWINHKLKLADKVAYLFLVIKYFLMQSVTWSFIFELISCL
jgi:hypothetical protein